MLPKTLSEFQIVTDSEGEEEVEQVAFMRVTDSSD